MLEIGVTSSTASSAATRVLKRPDVQRRINELKQKVTASTLARVSMDRTWVMERLKDNAEGALEARDRAAANRALELIGKEMGMFIDRKQEIKSPLDELTADELRDLLDRIRAGSPLLDVTPTRADHVSIADSSTPTSEIIELSASDVPRSAPDTPESGGSGGGNEGLEADDVV